MSLTVVPLAGTAAEPASTGDRSPGPGRPLTSVAEVKSWSGDGSLSVPVEIDGVVTCAAPAGNFFVHDGTMGIHVGQSETGRRLKPGDRVRVLGATRRGTYAPSIEPRELVLLGRGTLPSARSASYNEIASGTLDGQFLEIEAVVCDVNLEPAAAGPILTVATDGRRLRVTVYPPGGDEVETLIDAEVRLRGVASGTFNPQRQLVEPVLRVPGRDFITILRPAPADPFAVPVVPLTRLLGFSLEAPSPHRVRIRGVVTRRISDRVLFVRDGNLGLKLESRAPVGFNAGDVIEAVGFPVMAGGSAVMESAVCRGVGSGPAPAPVRPEPAALLDGSHQADLVSVTARLVDWVVAGETATLILQAQNQLFRATLQHANPGGVLPEKNTLVEATGICVISEPAGRSSYSPRAIMLLISAPSDITVMRRPDWWTPGRLGRALAAVLILLGAGLGWVWSLRRQVDRNRAVIEQQTRHAAVLQERSRIARDLHDTLEQGLTGLSLQLKVVEMDYKDSPQQVGAGLEAARQMLRRSRALAHHAIRELRTDDVARRGERLVAGLERIAEMWRQSGIPGVTVTAEGSECPLPEETERHLIRIGAEAITNAVKHGGATSITVSVRYDPDRLRLRIDDNGSGFNPTSDSGVGAGTFGLVGMRERAGAIGGKLDVQSRPGAGTSIVVGVPFSAAARNGATSAARSGADASTDSAEAGT